MFKQIISQTSLLIVLSIPTALAAEPEKQTSHPHPSSQELVNAKITPEELENIKQHRLKTGNSIPKQAIEIPRKSPFEWWHKFMSKNSILGPRICKGTTIGLGLVIGSIYLPFSNYQIPYKYELSLGGFLAGGGTILYSRRTNPLIKHAFTAMTATTLGSTAAIGSGLLIGSAITLIWFFGNIKK